MLASLHIENIALIRRLDLEPAEGFCAFTGETGAGKSILIDSIGLLCGARGERDLIRSGETDALVEGMFYPSSGEVTQALAALDVEPDEDGALFLQRKLHIDGRSSAKINGRSVPLSRLREVSSLLLNLHGQQDTQTLASQEKQRALLDAYAHDEPLLAQYRETYARLSALKKECAEAQKRAEALEERADLLSYQVRELKMAKIRPGEEAELFAEHALLANREKITENAQAVFDALYSGEPSAISLTQTARNALHRLASILPDGNELLTRLEDAQAELTDIAESIRAYAEPSEDSSDRLTYVEERLDRIAALKRKYKTDEAGLAQRLAEAQAALQSLENSDAEQEERRKQLRALQETLDTQADALHKARQASAETLAESVQNALSELDMPNVRFCIRVERDSCTPDGADVIDFSVSANAGEAPRPIGKIASGGELSRIMLCLQCVLADVEKIGTLIFDEIDTGISGKTNEKIGRMMRQIASDGSAQVICVTHAAQLAARASHQYRISKHEKDGRAETQIRLLEKEERISELARIMGGVQITDTVRLAAKELLEDPS